MRITVTVHSDEWKAKASEYVEAMRLASGDGSYEAATRIGRLVRAYLATMSHPPATKTPSAPGTPPAWITGHLAGSVEASRFGMDGAKVGPTAKYGRIQERGGGMTAHTIFGMRWTEDGVRHKAMHVDLPARPYLKPMTDLAIASGYVTDAYRDRWARAQHEVLG